jgi:argininosuccinate synthase
MERIVLAFSGTLETSAAIPWLVEQHRAEVVAVTLDLGLGQDLEAVRHRALACGAARAHVLDVREAFARDYVLPALRAGAMAAAGSPLAVALSRPLVARQLVEIAALESATVVAYGSRHTADRARLERLLRDLDPSLAVVAPAAAAPLAPDRIGAYARACGIPVLAPDDAAVRIDRNLWARTVECGPGAALRQEPPDDLFELTRAPDATPDSAAYVDIVFECGVPTAVNGVPMPLVELIQSLETIAGAHGVGRSERNPRGAGAGWRDRREMFDAPAARTLVAAHEDLRRFVTPPVLDRAAAHLARTYADLVEAGEWFTPTRTAIDALVAAVEERVTGTARLKLFKGDCRVVGRHSAFGPPGIAPSRPAQPAGVRA